MMKIINKVVTLLKVPVQKEETSKATTLKIALLLFLI